MEPYQPEQSGDIVGLLLKCHLLEKELAASSRLSVDECHVISQLYLKAPHCVKSLRELLGLDPTRLSKLLHDLEEHGYLTRSLDAVDKRKERLTLTAEGIAVARNLLASSARLAAQLAGSVTEEIARILASSEQADTNQTNSEVTAP